MNKPIIAILGRPNVGKSTLFNRFIGYRKAIVDDHPGVTRDRNYASYHWQGREFLLIDTGGFEPQAQEGLPARVRDQIQLAIEEADLILFLVSIRDGLSPMDEEIGRILRKETKKPILLAINKADSPLLEAESTEFLRLGFPNPFAISAEQGRGLGELLDAIHDAVPPSLPEEDPGQACRVAILGRPNVGKSSLFNRLLGSERAIVSEEPGTTRDALDTLIFYQGQPYLFIDTAGIRRQSKIDQVHERYGVIRALKTLERADVALILLDATAGVSVQDCKIASLVEERGCSSLLLVNKWDLMPKIPRIQKEFALDIRKELNYLDYAPVLFVSALTGSNVKKVLPEVERLAGERKRVVTTAALNKALQAALEAHHLPAFRGQQIKINYGTQLNGSPPTFLFFANNPTGIQSSYRRFLTHRLQETLDLRDTPIRLIFRRK